MMIWGGANGPNELDDGARYNPRTGRWQPLPAIDAPADRRLHVAVWTGREMLAHGGFGEIGSVEINTGGRYLPSSERWKSLTVAGAPELALHTAVWTGESMILFGGTSGASARNDTYSYRPPRLMHLYLKP